MQGVYLGSDPREKVGAVGMGVIWSSVIDLVITIGSRCLPLLGPLEKPYDVCLRAACPGMKGEAIIHWFSSSIDQG